MLQLLLLSHANYNWDVSILLINYNSWNASIITAVIKRVLNDCCMLLWNVWHVLGNEGEDWREGRVRIGGNEEERVDGGKGWAGGKGIRGILGRNEGRDAWRGGICDVWLAFVRLAWTRHWYSSRTILSGQSKDIVFRYQLDLRLFYCIKCNLFQFLNSFSSFIFHSKKCCIWQVNFGKSSTESPVVCSCGSAYVEARSIDYESQTFAAVTSTCTPSTVSSQEQTKIIHLPDIEQCILLSFALYCLGILFVSFVRDQYRPEFEFCANKLFVLKCIHFHCPVLSVEVPSIH